MVYKVETGKAEVCGWVLELERLCLRLRLSSVRGIRGDRQIASRRRKCQSFEKNVRT